MWSKIYWYKNIILFDVVVFVGLVYSWGLVSCNVFNCICVSFRDVFFFRFVLEWNKFVEGGGVIKGDLRISRFVFEFWVFCVWI